MRCPSHRPIIAHYLRNGLRHQVKGVCLQLSSLPPDGGDERAVLHGNQRPPGFDLLRGEGHLRTGGISPGKSIFTSCMMTTVSVITQ